MIDAGRGLQNMQLVVLSEGIGSGLFTGVREEKMRKDFNIPEDLNIAVIVGFGYPSRRLIGRVKNRMPLDKVVYYQRYGNSQIL